MKYVEKSLKFQYFNQNQPFLPNKITDKILYGER